jgi:hypothetical protein
MMPPPCPKLLFIENGFYDFDSISTIYEDHLPK